MPNPTTPEEVQPISADARAAVRATLEKLTKAELLDRAVELAARVDEMDARLDEALRGGNGKRVRPEDAFVVSALVDLHRAMLQAARADDAARFLDAALKAGVPLVDAILAD
jgi:hypothetical protein